MFINLIIIITVFFYLNDALICAAFLSILFRVHDIPI